MLRKACEHRCYYCRSCTSGCDASGPPTGDLIDLSSDESPGSVEPDNGWRDWVSQAVVLHQELASGCYTFERLLQNLVFVLFACRRLSCPLDLQRSMLEIAAAVDHMSTSAGKAIEPLNEFLDLLAAPETSSPALRDKMSCSWPVVERLDLDRLDNLCCGFEEYLAKHVTPDFHQVQQPATDEELLAESRVTFGAFSLN